MPRGRLTDYAANSRRASSVCRLGAGYDNFDVPALTRRGIPLATTGDANAGTVAEHALYLMLALAKRGPALERAIKGGAPGRAASAASSCAGVPASWWASAASAGRSRGAPPPSR